MTVNIFDMADTWNDAGTTFTAIKMDVTDTASASGSKLLDLLVGGVSKISGTKAGEMLVSSGTESSPSYSFVNDPDTGFYQATGLVICAINSARRVVFQEAGVQVGAGAGFSWSDLAKPSGGDGDLALRRDAADTLAQRRSTNPQGFRLYNTYTDASNYERLSISWASNSVRIQAQNAGTGTPRELEFRGGNGTLAFKVGTTSAVTFNDSKDIVFGTATGSRLGSAANQLIGFYGATPVTQQNVPLTSPTVQNVIDALVTLGLVEQSD